MAGVKHTFIDSPFWEDGDDFDFEAMLDVMTDPDFDVEEYLALERLAAAC